MTRPRNRIGAISLGAAALGFLFVTLQPWIPLDRVALFGALTLKRLLAAFFDASLVGALADWFAVSALFRNPLGVKLPHTDILAKNRDTIAQAVPRFLASFLSDDAISAELARVDYAGRAAALLGRADVRAELRELLRGRLPRLLSTWSREQLSENDARDETGGAESGTGRLPAGGTESWPGARSTPASDARARGDSPSPLVARLFALAAERFDLGTLAAGTAAWARRERLHVSLITGGAELLRSAIEGNHDRLVAVLTPVIKRNAGWQGLFVGRGVVQRLLTGITDELARVRREPNSEIRQLLTSSFESYADRLSGASDESRAARERIGERLRALLGDRSVQIRVSRLLASVIETLRADLSRPESLTIEAIEHALEGAALRLADDPALRSALNAEVAGAASELIRRSRVVESVAGYLASLLRATDERVFVDRIEEAVWNDLQYIRVNGAVVGGLVGLVLAIVSALLP